MGASFWCGWEDEPEDVEVVVIVDPAGPCPKCKKYDADNGHVSVTFRRNGKTSTIVCKGCGFQIPGCLNPRGAIRAWNQEASHG